MSKKFQGTNQWRQHIQLGRRKPGEAAPIEEPLTDTRKPPGWQGRAAKAKAKSKEGRAGSAPRPVMPQGKKAAPSANPAPGQSGSAKSTSTKPEAKTPVITPPKRVLVRPLDGEGRPYITLVQFLKSIAAVGTGGAGKHAVRAGGILVNGSEELRPGRKLHTGDVVKVAGAEHRIAI